MAQMLHPTMATANMGFESGMLVTVRVHWL